MAFYRFDPHMASELEALLDQIAKEGRPGLKNNIAISWIRYEKTNPEACSGIGAGWSEEKLLYPASIVKLIYAIAIEAWLQKDILTDSVELQQALKDMVKESSNDATSLIMDLLTGTTSGPSLHGERWHAWQKQRQQVNKWLQSLNWPELAGVNCCQKTWNDGPFGRERDFYGATNTNRNSLTTAATARLLEAVMTNDLVSPPACKRVQKLLSRSLDVFQREANPENQIDGFLGEGLPKGTRFWSKAGLMSQARHDAAWFCSPKANPMLLVVFTQGRERAKDASLLPSIARELSKLNVQMS